MESERTFLDEEKRVLAALGEIPAAESSPGEERDRLQELEHVAKVLWVLYDSSKDVPSDSDAPGEFQIERMEQARRLAGEAASRDRKPHRPVWTRLALVAAVILLGVFPFLILQKETGITDPTLAQQSNPSDPYVGIRGASPKDGLEANASAEAQALAPLGEIRSLRPLSFIWKSDPRMTWEMRLFRVGENDPIARVEGAKSPLSIERLIPESGILEAGGDFRWELANPETGEIATQGEFQLSQEASKLTISESEALLAAMESAIKEDRPSEALMLLFSLHESLAPETFIKLRKELEQEILQK